MELLYLYYYFGAINLITTIFFIWDKFKSQFTYARRISESSFHILELLGGCFSTFFLINLINHKSAKLSFQVISYTILGVWIYFIFKFKDFLLPFLN